MFNVKNEYGKLKKVLMASIESFQIHDPINLTQKFYYKDNPPILRKAIIEQKRFVDTLLAHDVEIVWAEKRVDCTNQVNTRDVSFVIGDNFIISPMKEKERQNEYLAILSYLKNDKCDGRVLRPTQGIIEGGDIVIDNDVIFIGISQRTNEEGVKWIIDNFSANYQIVPLYLSPGYLHLDVVFNIVSKKNALVHRQGLAEESMKLIKSRYEPIFTEEKEQIYLPTNVFSIDQNTIVADKRNHVTNKTLKRIGKKVIELDYTEISKIGGSFRCSTCPLIREEF